jgi:hypothetical protein
MRMHHGSTLQFTMVCLLTECPFLALDFRSLSYCLWLWVFRRHTPGRTQVFSSPQPSDLRRPKCFLCHDSHHNGCSDGKSCLRFATQDSIIQRLAWQVFRLFVVWEQQHAVIVLPSLGVIGDIGASRIPLISIFNTAHVAFSVDDNAVLLGRLLCRADLICV